MISNLTREGSSRTWLFPWQSPVGKVVNSPLFPPSCFSSWAGFCQWKPPFAFVFFPFFREVKLFLSAPHSAGSRPKTVGVGFIDKAVGGWRRSFHFRYFTHVLRNLADRFLLHSSCYLLPGNAFHAKSGARQFLVLSDFRGRGFSFDGARPVITLLFRLRSRGTGNHSCAFPSRDSFPSYIFI